MSDSDEELKLVKRPCRHFCFQIMDEDGDEDTNIDLEPSLETLPARSPDLLSNSAQTISRGGPTFCRCLYDAQAVNPSHVNHNPPMATSSSNTPMTTSGNIFHVEASRRPPNEHPGLLYFTEMEFSLRTHRPTLVRYILHLTASYMDVCTSKTRGEAFFITPATEVFRVTTMKLE